MEYRDARTEEREEMKRAVKALDWKDKFMRVIISLTVVLVLLASVTFAAWNAGRNHEDADKDSQIQEQAQKIQEMEDKIREMEDNPVIVHPAAPKIDLSIMNAEIHEIGELATVEYLFTDAGSYTDSAQIKDLLKEDAKSNAFTNWTIPGTEKSFTLKWDGVIKAGVQVKQIQVELQEEEKILTVSMPRAEILSYDTDENSVEILDEKNNVFNPIGVEDKVKFDKETDEAMKKRAIENGLLEKAEQSAEKIITGLILTNPGVDESYTIEFIYTE